MTGKQKNCRTLSSRLYMVNNENGNWNKPVIYNPKRQTFIYLFIVQRVAKKNSPVDLIMPQLRIKNNAANTQTGFENELTARALWNYIFRKSQNTYTQSTTIQGTFARFFAPTCFYKKKKKIWQPDSSRRIVFSRMSLLEKRKYPKSAT